tara:strand:+ start:320 stop:616 length:297 start_codon:yes stop_codon:yes gene_type:complete
MADKLAAPIGPGGGKQAQNPQQSNEGNPSAIGRDEGLNQNKDIIENVRKIIFRIQRKLDKQPDGKSSTKDIKDAIMKLERILKAKKPKPAAVAPPAEA